MESEAPVIFKAFPAELAGGCFRRGNERLLVVNASHPKVRQRFTLAHEFGHICCGHDVGTIIDTIEMVSGGDTSNVEVQANAFAAEFLVPKAVFENIEPEPDLELVVQLANQFGVSAIMMLYRFNAVDLVSEKRFKRLKQEIHDDDHIALLQHLRLTPIQDRIELMTEDDLPYASPSLDNTALGSVLNGTASIESAARAAGTPARRLATAIHP